MLLNDQNSIWFCLKVQYQHHIYNSLHEYHRMRARYPVYRQDHEGCIELTQIAPLLRLSPLLSRITANREHIGSCLLGEGK